ncbi:MAG: aryl-sulfate sulfotransferase [Acidimicrobiales bacterium]
MLRRIRLLPVVLCVVLFAVSCGDTTSSDSSDTSPGTANSVPTTAPPATDAPPTTADLSNLLDLGGPVEDGISDLVPTLEIEEGTGAVAPGWTLMNARPVGSTHGVALAFDETGAVVWAIEDEGFVGDTILTREGTVMYILDDATLREVDAEGRVVRDYASRDSTSTQDMPHDVIPVDVRNFHHEVAELPNGNLLTVSSQVGEYESATPLCGESAEDFTGTYEVTGDQIIELDRGTGEIVWSKSVWDAFDPIANPGTDFCNRNDPLGITPDRPNSADWSHVNAAVLTVDEQQIIVSSRHLDRIWAWSYADTAEITPEWVVGVGGIQPAPPDRFSHQHAPEPQEDGTVLVYDNGVARDIVGGTPTEPLFSRVVQYRIDADAGTADLLWEYRRDAADGTPIYSAVVGDVDRLANGDTLIVDGFLPEFRPQLTEIDDESRIVRVITFTNPDFGYLLYRAERVEPFA